LLVVVLVVLPTRLRALLVEVVVQVVTAQMSLVKHQVVVLLPKQRFHLLMAHTQSLLERVALVSLIGLVVQEPIQFSAQLLLRVVAVVVAVPCMLLQLAVLAVVVTILLVRLEQQAKVMRVVLVRAIRNTPLEVVVALEQ
jgi:hypothetical protein